MIFKNNNNDQLVEKLLYLVSLSAGAFTERRDRGSKLVKVTFSDTEFKFLFPVSLAEQCVGGRTTRGSFCEEAPRPPLRLQEQETKHKERLSSGRV